MGQRYASDAGALKASGGIYALAALVLMVASQLTGPVALRFPPVFPAPLPASSPKMDGQRQAFLQQQKLCLTQAVYYEARGEAVEGQEAVAEVVLNRVHAPRFPKSVCGVVFQGAARGHGCQFSFACDGSMKRAVGLEAWRKAEVVAVQALAGKLAARVGAATHYHTRHVAPGWSRRLQRLGRIGQHVFYAERSPARTTSVRAA